mmetsp:Transcript_30009/g.77746  ORF Transcript_30009/g.77746 Transcript_30009/m.77746 type:complete len:350 (-) Transcript_30009:77-1126(-)
MLALLCLTPVALSATNSVLPAGAIQTVSSGGIHIEPQWLSPKLISAMRKDAQELFYDGLFTPDGLTNTAVGKDRQGFSRGDRQTFRGGDGWLSDVGNRDARLQFSDRMYAMRQELAVGLGRPSLAVEGTRKHEMTYNWYEPGAKLGRHLDEHHEETKGTKGWMMPTRRSVTWLVYLNDGWSLDEGGSLRAFPRSSLSAEAVGADGGNLQVGWIDGATPVFMDANRKGGLSALYRRSPKGPGQEVLSRADFQVPRQPVDFSQFLQPKFASVFEQISTSRLDPRFATAAQAAGASDFNEFSELHHIDVQPKAGTLVLFDSVSMPHLVREVTGSRQRIAATGWFHEDSIFPS